MGCKWLAGLVWEGLGGLGLGCEWLAGLVVWEGLGCVGFVYKIVEITAASSNNGGSRVVGLLCMGRNRAGSNLAVHFDFFFPCQIFLSVDRSHLRRSMATLLYHGQSMLATRPTSLSHNSVNIAF